MDERELEKLYSSLALPSGYASLDKLKHASRLPRSRVAKWLEGEDSYTLHKPIRKRFPRNPYTVNNINDLFEMDLVDMRNVSKYNKGYTFLLNVIDTFSKFAWSVPIKNKKGITIVNALRKILDTTQVLPHTIQSDKGKEFLNVHVQSFLKRKGIHFHTSHNPQIKCAIIERYNRTQRNRMFRYFTARNSYTYIDILQDLVLGYNNSVHSTIGMSPSQVTPADVNTIWRRMQKKKEKIKKGKVKFHVGDSVRITKDKGVFGRGYEETFTHEIFTVAKVIERLPQPVYELIDDKNEPIIGQFYNYELVRVQRSPDKEYKIDKILHTRNKKGIREHLVKWKGYGDSFNSYVKASELKKI
jgi:transposase InsO family protein